jgi:hypothetical protein
LNSFTSTALLSTLPQPMNRLQASETGSGACQPRQVVGAGAIFPLPAIIRAAGGSVESTIFMTATLKMLSQHDFSFFWSLEDRDYSSSDQRFRPHWTVNIP